MISSSPSAARRRASAARTASGSLRISLRSSIALVPSVLLARSCGRLGGPARPLARVGLHELGDVLRIAPDDHVRRHDRAGEAAVANRVQHVLPGLLADVEVGTVGAL